MRTKFESLNMFGLPSFTWLFILWCHDAALIWTPYHIHAFHPRHPCLPHVYSILPPLALSHWRSFPEVWRGNCGSSIRGNEKCERGKTVGVEILRNDQPTWEHSWICQEQSPILGSKDMPFKLPRNVSLSHPENICGSSNTSARIVVFWNSTIWNSNTYVSNW